MKLKHDVEAFFKFFAFWKYPNLCHYNPDAVVIDVRNAYETDIGRIQPPEVRRCRSNEHIRFNPYVLKALSVSTP